MSGTDIKKIKNLVVADNFTPVISDTEYINIIGGLISSLGTSVTIDFETPLNAKENINNKAVNFVTLNHSLYPTTLAVSDFVTGLGYITGNENITLNGVVTGSGTTSITTSFASTTGSGAVVLQTSPTIQTSLNINADTSTTLIRDQIGTSTNAAIYFNQTTPSATNYAILGTTNQTRINAIQDVLIRVADATKFNIDTITTNFTQGIATSGNVTSYIFTSPNNTGQTASTNIPAYIFNTGTRQYLTGTLSLQEQIRITSPTYSFVAASTITESATLSVNAATAGTNATITANLAARFIAGTTSLKIGQRVGTPTDFAIYFNAATPSTNSTQIWGNTTTLTLNGNSGINIQAGTTNAIVINNFLEQTYTNVARTSGATTAFTWTKANSTNQTAGTNIPGYLITTGSRQWATGNIVLQEEVRITAPTYSFVNASTITDAATLSINAPIVGTNATITNAWAIRSNGNINVLGQALVTAGTATTRIGAYGANQSAIWFNQTTPTTVNYALFGSATQTFFNATSLIGLAINDSSTITINSSAMNLIDGKNVTFGTTIGGKLGTSTNQLISIWNATPISQPNTSIVAAVFNTNTSGILNDTATFDGYTIGQAIKALRNFGLLA